MKIEMFLLRRVFRSSPCGHLVASALLVLIVPVLSLAAPVPVEHISADGLWRHVDESLKPDREQPPGALNSRPGRILSLNLDAFQDLADSAPLEFTSGADEAAPVMALPLPDGTFGRFAVQESPIMEPELAALLWQIRTYRAQGIDDPTATARLDFTPSGFHGFILSSRGTVYIDPYVEGDIRHYVSYWRRDYQRPEGSTPFHCDVTNLRETAPGQDEDRLAPLKFVALPNASGASLRTFRLAVAATGEYTAFHGGTVEGAQAAITTTVNRVNGIYEKELAVRLTLVNNTSIIYTDANADPYANTSDDLDANQTTIDNAVGSANYDIGHLVGTGGGGVAEPGVCQTNKAKGLTGSSSPQGDAFDVDYVAHEIGHQFNGNHTFNATSGSCGGGNRVAEAAYEPGSGSTIIAYAGICAPENLQNNSDPYFHTKTFDEIQEFIANWATCGVSSATGNGAPSVTAAAAITIPRGTPFYLTGSATDPNGDTLTYCWEEFDLGTETSSLPLTDLGTNPIFRSFNPVSSPTRTFPKLSDILANTTTYGETLPTTTRTMTFRLTARDNKAGGGGVAYAARTVSVTSAAGPFQVTAPNTAVSWTGGSSETVTWDIANTTASPVSCASVKILLSTDGGNTFPTELHASTTNDGSESVTVPSSATTTARVKVECATSPFFDISNADFTITASSLEAPTNVVATATTATNVSITWDAVAGATSYKVFRSANGSTYSQIGAPATNSYNDTTAAADTAYLYKVRASDGGDSGDSNVDLTTTVDFTDKSITAGSTLVKAAHITELRTAVNAVRTLAGLASSSFTDPTITAGVTKSKTTHVTELRSALDAARSSLSLAAVTYTDATLTAGSTPIRAAHVNDLLGGVR